jgi:acyl-CoA thioester hydrolase
MVKTTEIMAEVEKNYIDKYGHVNYSVHLQLYELGHKKLLESLGLSFEILQTRYGLKTLVRHAEVEYLHELFERDRVTVQTGISRIGKTSMTYDQNIDNRGVPISKAKITVVFVDGQGKPTEVPQDVRGSLERLLE